MKKLTLRRAMLIMIVTLCAVAFLHAATTQYFAHKLQYQDVFLGKPLYTSKRNQKLYLPWKVHTWSNAYRGGHIDSLIDKCALVLWIGAFASLGLSVVVSLRKPVHRTSHGSARFATEDEVLDWGWTKTPEKRAQKLNRAKKPVREADSITFAKTRSGKHLYDWSPAHVLFAAITRGGKGISGVIPSLLTWRGSAFVLDLKGENYAITGWWRSLFSHLIYFNPTKRSSARFNPLLEVRKGDSLIRDVMNIVEILSERDKGDENIFWDSGSKKLLVAVIIYVLYTQEEKTLGLVADLILDVDELLGNMAATDFGESYLNRFIHRTAASFQAKDEKIRGGWAAGAEVVLDLWKDPVVRAVTSTSDFRLRDFQYAKRPLSLFFVIPPGDIKRLSVFVRLFITQLTDALTEDLSESILEKAVKTVKKSAGRDELAADYEDDDQWVEAFKKANDKQHQLKAQKVHKAQAKAAKLTKQEKGFHRLLMLCDEFPQFGRMEKIERAVSYTAGYGIKWFFITQGFNQITERYGPNNSIVPNCHIHLSLRAADVANAKILEQRLGTMTAVKKQRSRSTQYHSKGGNKRTESVTEIEYAKPLMSADEWSTMDEDRLVVMCSGKPAYKAYRTTYYNDKRFKKKFHNRLLQWPRQRLDDFPSRVVHHDWGTDYIEIKPIVGFDADLEEHDLELNPHFDDQPRYEYKTNQKMSFEDAEAVAVAVDPDPSPQATEQEDQVGAVNDLLSNMFGAFEDQPTDEDIVVNSEETTKLSDLDIEGYQKIDAWFGGHGD